jgi:hypothetical protein
MKAAEDSTYAPFMFPTWNVKSKMGDSGLRGSMCAFGMRRSCKFSG